MKDLLEATRLLHEAAKLVEQASDALIRGEWPNNAKNVLPLATALGRYAVYIDPRTLGSERPKPTYTDLMRARERALHEPLVETVKRRRERELWHKNHADEVERLLSGTTSRDE